MHNVTIRAHEIVQIENAPALCRLSSPEAIKAFPGVPFLTEGCAKKKLFIAPNPHPHHRSVKDSDLKSIFGICRLRLNPEFSRADAKSGFGEFVDYSMQLEGQCN